jgi:hypothetical protein
MKLAGALMTLGASLTVGACVAGPPPGPPFVVMPGKDKSEVAFQQDQSICQQHAIAHTGYDDSSQHPNGPTPPTQAPAASGTGAETPAMLAGATPLDDLSYMQCMAARGDIVQLPSMDGYPGGYPYNYPYPYSSAAYPYSPAYPYPSGYGYPYGYPYYAGFVGGGWWHGGVWGWHHGGWSHAGWRGGWAHAGFHGSGGHGGGGHGGGGHH